VIFARVDTREIVLLYNQRHSRGMLLHNNYMIPYFVPLLSLQLSNA